MAETCSECDKPIAGRGLCGAHWMRLKRAGGIPDRQKKSIEERYWEKVIRDDSGCWGWSGATTGAGYGKIGDRASNKTLDAHRISWEIHNGPIPPGLLVCHRCDNPPCSNPEHLFLGTVKDNYIDALEKGRVAHHLKSGRLVARETTLIGLPKVSE